MKRLLSLAFSLFAFSSFGGGFSVNMKHQLSVSVTGTSTKFLDTDPLRNYLIIQNLGTEIVIVKFGSAQTASEGIQIAAGGSYEPVKGFFDSVWLKSASGTQSVMIVDGQ